MSPQNLLFDILIILNYRHSTNSRCKRTHWSSFYFLKGDKTPIWKLPSLYQEEGRYSYHQRWEIGEWETCLTKLVKLPFLVTSPFTTPSPNPFVTLILHKFGHFFKYLFSFESSSCPAIQPVFPATFIIFSQFSIYYLYLQFLSQWHISSKIMIKKKNLCSLRQHTY